MAGSAFSSAVLFTALSERGTPLEGVGSDGGTGVWRWRARSCVPTVVHPCGDSRIACAASCLGHCLPVVHRGLEPDAFARCRHGHRGRALGASWPAPRLRDGRMAGPGAVGSGLRLDADGGERRRRPGRGLPADPADHGGAGRALLARDGGCGTASAHRHRPQRGRLLRPRHGDGSMGSGPRGAVPAADARARPLARSARRLGGTQGRPHLPDPGVDAVLPRHGDANRLRRLRDVSGGNRSRRSEPTERRTWPRGTRSPRSPSGGRAPSRHGEMRSTST